MNRKKEPKKFDRRNTSPQQVETPNPTTNQKIEKVALVSDHKTLLRLKLFNSHIIASGLLHYSFEQIFMKQPILSPTD